MICLDSKESECGEPAWKNKLTKIYHENVWGASMDRWPRKNRDTLLSMQGWGQENQSPPGTQSVKGHQMQQAEFLWGISSKRKSRENVEDCCWMAQGFRWEICARGKGTQCLCCLSLLVRLRNPETMRLVEKYGAVKTYLWCEGGSNKGTFKQNQHAQVHGTWWAASTSIEGVGSHCKATLDYHLWRKNSWWLGEAPEDWKIANVTFFLKKGKMWGTAGWKALPLCWEDCGEKKILKLFLNILWTRWLGVVTVRKGKSCPMSKYDQVVTLKYVNSKEVIWQIFTTVL